MYEDESYEANLEALMLAVQQANNEAADYAAYEYRRATSPVMDQVTTTDEYPW